jgi:hypothetical protein
MEYDGMLVPHTVHVIYGWKSRSLKLLKESQPSVPDGFQLIHISIMLLYTVHYRNNIPQDVQEFAPSVNVQSVNEFYDIWLKFLHLQHKFYSQITCASFRLRSLTLRKSMCDQMKFLLRCNLIISNGSFPSTCGLEFQVTVTWALAFYHHKLEAKITLKWAI